MHYAVGPASCAVPGLPAGLDALWREHGRLPWARLVEPALRLARTGADLPPRHAACLAMLEPVMTLNRGAELYAPGGRLLAAGDRLEQPGLVAALELARRGGRRERVPRLDRGGAARRRRDVLVTRADLEAYEARWSEPVEVAVRGHALPDARRALGRARSCSRRLPRLAGLSATERVLALVDVLDDAGPEGHTTNLCVVDAEGRAVVLTSSLGLGSGDFLPGLDLHLNSMLGEHDLIDGPLEPGARMQSMMAPSRGARRRRARAWRSAPRAARGCARRSCTVAAGVLDEGLAPQEAVDRPRVHPAGGTINAEPGVDEEALRQLEAAGRAGAPLARSPPLLRRHEPRLAARAPARRSSPQRRGARACAGRSSGLAGQLCGPRRRRVASTSRGDLVDQRLLALEDLLVAEALPELDDEPLPVQVALEVEQERLDLPLAAAVVRVRPDRDRRRRARAPRRRRCRSAGTSRCASTARFAVGKPSVPPRSSPTTTVPSTSGGRPSMPRPRRPRRPRAAAGGSPSTRRPRGTAPPARRSRARGAARDRRGAGARSGTSPPRPRPRHRSRRARRGRSPPARAAAASWSNVDDERVLDAEARRSARAAARACDEQLDAVAERDRADAGRT